MIEYAEKKISEGRAVELMANALEGMSVPKSSIRVSDLKETPWFVWHPVKFHSKKEMIEFLLKADEFFQWTPAQKNELETLQKSVESEGSLPSINYKRSAQRIFNRIVGRKD
jgi:hypothetical protein